MTTPSEGTTSPLRGWYPDPFERVESRWWDGRAWTPHASDDGVAVVIDSDPSLAPSEDREPNDRRVLVALSTIATCAALAALAFWLSGPDRVDAAPDAQASELAFDVEVVGQG